MKILVSSGLGRLHLGKVSSILKEYTDNSIVFMTGSIPNKFIAGIIFFIVGRLIYSYKPSIKRIDSRIPKGFKREDIISLHAPDLALFIFLLLSKVHLCSVDKAYSISYYLFGLLSSVKIKDFDLLYIRAGAGSRIINKAKKLNKLVIVDYSSAHPSDIYKSLKQSKSMSAIKTFEQRKTLWKMSILDVVNSDLVVVNSLYVKQSLVDNGIPKDKIFINNLPININNIPCKASYDFSSEIHIAYSGRFISWKGCDTLLDVIDELSKVYSNIKLNIYGIVESHYFNNETFIRLKKSNHIVEHGLVSQERLFKNLTNSDIYIFLSYSEGSAQSVKEAMAIGMPVICSKSTGAPVVHNKNGLICDIDKKSCYKATSCLIDNIGKRIEIGRSARLEIETNHSNLRFVSVFTKMLKYKGAG